MPRPKVGSAVIRLTRHAQTPVQVENEKLLWRSADQTYNSMNFLVKGDVIFCGYGFTAEDDYLYQLDKNTGEVIDRLPLKKMPDLMAEKDDRLYVHTYSYDYVIGIF